MTQPDAYGLRAIGAASRLELVDYGVATLRSTAANSSGVSIAVFDQVASDQLWLVDRLVVTHESTSDATCLLYEDGPDPGKLLDGTSSGVLDIADESSPVIVRGSTSLYVQWSGCTVGSRGTVRVNYRLMRRL